MATSQRSLDLVVVSAGIALLATMSTCAAMIALSYSGNDIVNVTFMVALWSVFSMWNVYIDDDELIVSTQLDPD